MTDIVEHLAAPASLLTLKEGTKLLHDARTEIERLREAIQTQGNEIDRLCKLAHERYEEIERLRRTLKRIEDTVTFSEEAYELQKWAHAALEAKS